MSELLKKRGKLILVILEAAATSVNAELSLSCRCASSLVFVGWLDSFGNSCLHHSEYRGSTVSVLSHPLHVIIISCFSIWLQL